MIALSIPPTRSRSTAVSAAVRTGNPPAHAADADAIGSAGDGIAAVFEQEHEREALEQSALAAQQQQFNFQIQERSESLRENNELHALAMEQMKLDDENLKKWIALVA